MSSPLRIRMYNVGLGDCFLVSIPARTETKHVLIDFGSTRGKNKDDLLAIGQDILETIGDEPISVILTHGHLDHLKGLHYLLDELDERVTAFLTTKHLWSMSSSRLGTSEGPVRSLISDLIEDRKPSEEEEELVQNRANSSEMIDQICSQLGKRVRYLTRGARQVLGMFLRGTGASIEVLAPEKDIDRYVERIFSKVKESTKKIGRGLILEKIKERISSRHGLKDLLLQERSLDNSTSLVLELGWEDKRILLPGDAEIESWKIMSQEDVLRPFDVLKVSHHASSNGTPNASEKIWTSIYDVSRNPSFLISTYPRKDWGMPDRELLDFLKSKGSITSSEKMSSMYTDYFCK
ncbi:MAG: MBL fold metallo-hydrolase [Candidatus Lokiarchaeota archaeon]|nr:MBL fold metallo-hydrolase [Candidatus Lokiarchaeota archaeon]